MPAVDFEQVIAEIPFLTLRGAARSNLCKRCRLPWNDDSEAYSFPFDADLTDQLIDWFFERGLIIYSINDGNRHPHFAFAPIVRIESPQYCFHTALFERVQGIFERGLLTGRAAGYSTTGRQDCARFIHVSLDELNAEKWARSDLLAALHRGKEFAILRIDLNHTSKKLFRDPMSATGYIFDGTHIPQQAITLIRRVQLTAN